MAFEHRDGICTTCSGRIHRYPHPQSDHADVWAHLDRDDWEHNAHVPLPRTDAECACGGALSQHPTIPERWAHIDKAHIDGTHAAQPKAVTT